MATYTDNYALVKPTYGELADVAVINGNMDTIDGIMHSNRTMLAPAFSQTEDYAVGDVVVYEGNLYRFIVPHTAGNWDGTEVEQTTLGEEVSTKGGADVTKTASGNPIEITDGASAPLVKCVTAIQGNQDLHGYDKPWVGGAGKNKIPVLLSEVKSNNTSGTWSGDTYSYSGVTFKVESNSEGYVTKITVNASLSSSAFSFYLKRATTSFTSDTILNGCPSGGGDSTYDLRVSGGYRDYGVGATIPANASFSDFWIVIRSGITVSNLVFQPMIRLATESDPTFEPYSNICPITAYTEGEIEVRGKNLFDETYTGISSNVTYQPINVGSGVEVTLKTTCPREDNIGCCLFLLTGSVSSGANNNTNGVYAGNPRTVTATSGYITIAYRTQTTVDPRNYDTFLYDTSEIKNSTTTYHSAIYQGNADFIGSGSPSVVCNMPVIDLGDLTWSAYTTDTTGHSFYVNVPSNTKSVTSDSSVANLVCENYETVAFLNPSEWVRRNAIICQVPNTQRWIVRDERFSDATSFTTAVTGIKLAYELATPTTETITPTNLPIKSLFGYNHIESSTGDMEIEYITEEFQPIVDLIESNSGKVTQDILYTASTMSETEIDVDLTAYDEYIIFANDVLVTTQIPQGSTFPRITFDMVITNNSSIVIYGYDDCSCIYTVSSNKLTYNSGRGGYRITMIIGVKVGDVSTSQTLNRSLRSLNLTKSAVEEIPDEIKNAEYEEKPDVNEADDNAPTEVDER